LVLPRDFLISFWTLSRGACAGVGGIGAGNDPV
jgi:hypothetical protein